MNSTSLADTTPKGRSSMPSRVPKHSCIASFFSKPSSFFLTISTSWVLPAGISPIQGTAHPMSYSWSESGGWDRFGSSDNGSPPSFYQWQPLSFAFNIMLTLERRAMRRYSLVVRLRVDGKFQSKMPSIETWSQLFLPDSAYAYKS